MHRGYIIEDIKNIDSEILETDHLDCEETLSQLNSLSTATLNRIHSELTNIAQMLQTDVAVVENINAKWEFEDETVCPTLNVDVFYRAARFRCDVVLKKYL